jgi:hypothetical protein
MVNFTTFHSPRVVGLADTADEFEGLEVIDETDFEELETDCDGRYTTRAKGKGPASRPDSPVDGFQTNYEGRYTTRATGKGCTAD